MLLSILDTDLYKFSMSCAYMKLYDQAEGTFTFIDRNHSIHADQEYIQDLRNYINDWFCKTRMTVSEFAWAKKTIPYIPEFYWEWLMGFTYDINNLNIYPDEDGNLTIKVSDKLYKSTLYEVPVLALVSEFNNKREGRVPNLELVRERTIKKAETSNQYELKFSEFGTRRRFSAEVQELVVRTLKEHAKYCVGTSNVYFAYKYDMIPIGTVAHEFVMFHGANYGYREANYKAYEAWAKVYDGSLGIALTDTYTTKAFFDNFSLSQAKLFDGIRHDSGDEYEFTNQAIEYYKSRGIDPKSKTIVFSNALTMDKFRDIAQYCKEHGINASAGIGTHLTNDTDFPPYNIVMKLTECRLTPKTPMRECIKISDDKGKYLGPVFEFEKAKHDLNLSL